MPGEENVRLTMSAYQQKCRFLIHCAIMATYNDIDLGRHWLRQWHVPNGTTHYNPVRPTDIHLRAIYRTPHASFTKINLEITHQKFYFNLPGASKLSLSLNWANPATALQQQMHVWKLVLMRSVQYVQEKYVYLLSLCYQQNQMFHT